MDRGDPERAWNQKLRSSLNAAVNLDHHDKAGLIISLYNNETGYSICLPIINDQAKEVYVSYSDDEFFSYVSIHQIPPVVQEFLLMWKREPEILLCEIRDYRLSDARYDSHFIHLRPIIAELNSRGLPPICLDPNNEVTFVTNRLYNNQKKYFCFCLKKNLQKKKHQQRLYSTDNEWFPLQFSSSQKSMNASVKMRKFSEAWKYKARPPRVTKLTNILQFVLKNAKEICSGHSSINDSSFDDTGLDDGKPTYEDSLEPSIRSRVGDHSDTCEEEEMQIGPVSSLGADHLPVSDEPVGISSRSVIEGPVLPSLIPFYRVPKSTKARLPKLRPIVGDLSDVHRKQKENILKSCHPRHPGKMPILQKMSTIAIIDIHNHNIDDDYCNTMGQT